MAMWNTFGQREAQPASGKQSLLDKLAWIKPWGQDSIQLSVLKELKCEIAELPMQSLHQPPPQGSKVSNVIGSCMNNRISNISSGLQADLPENWDMICWDQCCVPSLSVACHSGWILAKFAEDIKLFIIIKAKADCCRRSLYQLTVKCQMKFSIDKCKVRHLGKKITLLIHLQWQALDSNTQERSWVTEIKVWGFSKHHLLPCNSQKKNWIVGIAEWENTMKQYYSTELITLEKI